MSLMWSRMIKGLVAVNLLMGLAGLAARLLLVSRGGPESDEVDLVAVYEELHLRSHSSSFLGGSAFALFGGLVLDLRRARLGPTGAQLVVVTVFGATTLVAPPDWRIEVDAHTWMGGLDMSHQSPDDPDAPLLRIRARTFFGGCQVQSRPRLEAVS